MLQFYFPFENDFLHEREDYVFPQSRSRANVTMGVLDNEERKRALVVEWKTTPRNRSGYTPPNSWTAARNQLETFLLGNRGTLNSLPYGVFGVVAIGMYVRLFQLRNNSLHTEDFQSDSRTFQIENDQRKIERKIRAIKTVIDSALGH